MYLLIKLHFMDLLIKLHFMDLISYYFKNFNQIIIITKLQNSNYYFVKNYQIKQYQNVAFITNLNPNLILCSLFHENFLVNNLIN